MMICGNLVYYTLIGILFTSNIVNESCIKCQKFYFPPPCYIFYHYQQLLNGTASYLMLVNIRIQAFLGKKF